MHHTVCSQQQCWKQMCFNSEPEWPRVLRSCSVKCLVLCLLFDADCVFVLRPGSCWFLQVNIFTRSKIKAAAAACFFRSKPSVFVLLHWQKRTETIMARLQGPCWQVNHTDTWPLSKYCFYSYRTEATVVLSTQLDLLMVSFHCLRPSDCWYNCFLKVYSSSNQRQMCLDYNNTWDWRILSAF